jgi:hypothetical protein
MANNTEIAGIIQTLFNENADELAKQTGFIKRQRKFSGSTFAKSLVFGWWANPNSSLSELQQAAKISGVSVTAQAIDYRFTYEASEFMYQLLNKGMENCICADSPVALSILDRFEGVYLDDSSVISLPDSLKNIWEGCGGSYGANSALKIQFSYDYKKGSIRYLSIHNGKEQDKNSPSQQADLAKKSLRIHDKGFNSLKVKNAYNDNQIYWLCPYKIDVNIYDNQGEKIDIVKLLKKTDKDELDTDIMLGKKHRVRCRMLATRVPEDVVKQRIQRLIKEASRKQRQVSERAIALSNWTILITNIPNYLLTTSEGMILYKIRWQVEIIFKLWKSYNVIDEWRTQKDWRILCEIYAKLLGVLVQHWTFLCTFWHLSDKSLMKGSLTLKKQALHILDVINNIEELCKLLEKIGECLRSGCRVQKRKTKATFELLLSISDP